MNLIYSQSIIHKYLTWLQTGAFTLNLSNLNYSLDPKKKISRIFSLVESKSGIKFFDLRKFKIMEQFSNFTCCSVLDLPSTWIWQIWKTFPSDSDFVMKKKLQRTSSKNAVVGLRLSIENILLFQIFFANKEINYKKKPTIFFVFLRNSLVK